MKKTRIVSVIGPLRDLKFKTGNAKIDHSASCLFKTFVLHESLYLRNYLFLLVWCTVYVNNLNIWYTALPEHCHRIGPEICVKRNPPICYVANRDFTLVQLQPHCGDCNNPSCRNRWKQNNFNYEGIPVFISIWYPFNWRKETNKCLHSDRWRERDKMIWKINLSNLLKSNFIFSCEWAFSHFLAIFWVPLLEFFS